MWIFGEIRPVLSLHFNNIVYITAENNYFIAFNTLHVSAICMNNRVFLCLIVAHKRGRNMQQC